MECRWNEDRGKIHVLEDTHVNLRNPRGIVLTNLKHLEQNRTDFNSVRN